MTVDWFDRVLLAVVLTAALLYAFPRKSRLKKFGDDFARKHLAYVDSEFVDEFDRTQLRERRIAAAVLVCMVAGLWLIEALFPRPDELMPGVLAVAVAVLAAIQLSHAGREFPPPPERTAVARTRTVHIQDYVHPSLLWLCGFAALLVVAVGGLAAHAVLASSDDLPRDEGIGITVAAALVTLPALIGPLYLLMLCRKPEPAVDAAHLYFQDAWRTVQMHTALGAWLFAAVLAVIPVLWFAPEWVLNSAAVPAASLGLLFWVIWAMDRSKLHFRRQLWPTLQPGQVLLPGELLSGRSAR